MAALVNIFSDYAPGKPYATQGPVDGDWNFGDTTMTIKWRTDVPADSPYTLYDVKTFVIDLLVVVSDPDTVFAEKPATYIGGGQWTYGGVTATLTGASGLEIPDPSWVYLYTTTRQDGAAYPYESLGDLAPGESGFGEIQLAFSGPVPNDVLGFTVSSDDFARVNTAASMPEPATFAIWLGLAMLGGLVWRGRRSAA